MKTFLYHENGWRMIQAEELPVKPREPIAPENKSPNERPDYYLDLERYESEIAALKAKSIPVWNTDAFINTQGYWIDTKFWSNKPKDDAFYIWPGDVEIKDGVAILTLPKEQ